MKISAQEEYGLRCLVQLASLESGDSLTLHGHHLSSNLIVPLGPERTLTIFEWFAYSGDVAQATIDFSDEIQQEDIRICEEVQRGLNSRSYSTGRFSVKRENGGHYFHQMLGRALQRHGEPRQS